ncbi:MAG: hypothetical protein KAJ53_11485 [Anaerolineales bacterium]|nr:hypothetical protein [Anaerolineales bacterium]
MKKTVVLAMMLLAILFVGVVPALAAEDDAPDLARLTVINKTDGKVFLQLNGTNAHFLTIGAGSTAEFTVEKEEFVRQTWACGAYAKGLLDMSSQVKLVFTPCGIDAPNAGEPTQEKIDMADSPGGMYWRYQDVE